MGKITETQLAVAIVNMVTVNVRGKQVYFDART